MALKDLIRQAVIGANVGAATSQPSQRKGQAQSLSNLFNTFSQTTSALEDEGLLHSTVEGAVLKARELENSQGIRAKIVQDDKLGKATGKPFRVKFDSMVETDTGKLSKIKDRFGVKLPEEDIVEEIRTRLEGGQAVVPGPEGGIIAGRPDSLMRKSVEEGLARVKGLASKKLGDLSLSEQIAFLNPKLKEQGFELDLTGKDIGVKAFGQNLSVEDLGRIGRSIGDFEELILTAQDDETKESLIKLRNLLLAKADFNKQSQGQQPRNTRSQQKSFSDTLNF